MKNRTVTVDQMFNLPVWELRMSVNANVVRWKLPLSLMVAGRLYQDKKPKKMLVNVVSRPLR